MQLLETKWKTWAQLPAFASSPHLVWRHTRAEFHSGFRTPAARALFRRACAWCTRARRTGAAWPARTSRRQRSRRVLVLAPAPAPPPLHCCSWRSPGARLRTGGWWCMAQPGAAACQCDPRRTARLYTRPGNALPRILRPRFLQTPPRRSRATKASRWVPFKKQNKTSLGILAHPGHHVKSENNHYIITWEDACASSVYQHTRESSVVYVCAWALEDCRKTQCAIEVIGTRFPPRAFAPFNPWHSTSFGSLFTLKKKKKKSYYSFPCGWGRTLFFNL